MADLDQFLAQRDAQTAAEPLDNFLQQRAARETQMSVAQVADTNPDTEAKLQQLARQYNLPVDAVRLQQPQVERRATIDSLDYDKIATDTPALAGWLSDPRRASIALDDVEPMGAMERITKSFVTNPLKSAYIGLGPSFASSVYGAAETGLGTVEELLRGLGAQEQTPFGLGQDFFHGLRKSEEAKTQSIVQSMGDMGFIERNINAGVQSTAQLLPSAIMSALTGNPTPMLATGALSQGGQSAGKALDAGLTPARALAYGIEDATAEVMTERIPVGALLKDLKVGAPLWQTLMHQALTEVPTELAATTIQNFNEYANLTPNEPFSSYLKKLPEDLAATIIATLTSVGAQTGIVHGATRVMQRGAQAQAAQQNAQTLAQIDQIAAASKLRERDPESFQQFVEQATQDGPVTDVYVDPKALAQSGIDLNTLAQASPSVAAQLSEALATRSDIKIPVSEYASRVAGTEISGALLDHLKTEPNGMSRADAEVFFQTQGEQLKAEVEKILTEKQADDVFKQSRDAVYQNVLGQLTQANRFTEDVNKPYATLMSNFYSVMAARTGQTPEQMFQQFPVKITAEQVGKGATLDQGALPAGEYLNMPANPTKEVLDSFGRVEEVPLTAARRTQSRMDWEKFNKGEHPGALVQGYEDKPVAVRLENGEYLVYDGHHRTVKAIEAGKQSLPMYVVDAKQYDPANAGRKSAPVSQQEIDKLLSDLGTTFDQEANGSTPYSEPTITIDGVEKPTTNSNGQPIAATKEGLENFWRWFGDSKVVDADGKPLVVYHGTKEQFDTFNLNKVGRNGMSLGAGFYFSDAQSIASGYGNTLEVYLRAANPTFDINTKTITKTQVKSIIEAMEKEDQYFLSNYGDIESEGRSAVLKLALDDIYSASENDADVITALINVGGVPRESVMREVVQTTGKDGFVVDGGIASLAADGSQKVYSVLLPEQIKSIYNRGTFSPTDPNILNQPAYHGSPHAFEKFDLSKIGTGEGAQAYGWGLYFAENKNVAEDYRKKLADFNADGRYVWRGGKYTERSGPEAHALGLVYHQDIRVARSIAKQGLEDARKGEPYALEMGGEAYYTRMLEVANSIRSKREVQNVKGQTYTIEIPDEAYARMLDYDKPFSEQPQSVKSALTEAGVVKDYRDNLSDFSTPQNTRNQKMRGENIYAFLSHRLGSDKAASEYLNSIGIPGLYYKDEGSRNKRGGTRNIVVWSQDVLDQINESVDTLYQSTDIDPDAAPWYYSQVQKVVENLKMSKAPGEQWLKTIQNTPGVKQEELDWMGLPEWLAAQEGSITKADLLQFIEANQIKVDEVVKGEPVIDEEAVAEEAQRRYDEQVDDIFDSMDVPSAYIDDTGSTDEGEPLYTIYIDGEYVNETTDFDEAQAIETRADEQAQMDARRQAEDEVDYDAIEDDVRTEMEAQAENETKFERWQLPRGQNYRELLLTLPVYRPIVPYKREDLELKPEVEGRDKWDVYVPASFRTISVPKNLAATGEDAIQYILEQKMGFEGARTSLIGGAYTSSAIGAADHFDETNIMAHVRFNERRDMDGKRVLFIEEIQSDWHQAGREKGYDDGKDEPEFAVYSRGTRVVDNLTEEQAQAEAARLAAEDPSVEYKADRTGYKLNKGVPDAPFKTTWPELAFKRALRWAVDNGFDRVAWTTGEQQADRYDLSKQIDHVSYSKNEDGTFEVRVRDLNDNTVWKSDRATSSEVADTLGKEIAEKMSRGEGESMSVSGDILKLSGDGLKVGGEGMRAFYDKMLPNMVNKMVKKWGGKAGTTFIKTGTFDKPLGETEVDTTGWTAEEFKNGFGEPVWRVNMADGRMLDTAIRRDKVDNAAEAIDIAAQIYKQKRAKETGTEVHSLDITPEMRAAAKAGLALFQEKRGAFNPSTNTITLLKAADLSTFLHESGHFFLETMNKLALDANAPADITQDMDILLKWFGVGSLVEWNAMTLDQQRDSHEKFARGFEAYLFEGKAPSLELKGVFQRFAAWLKNVYRQLTALKVELNDDVRQVFDRMLATDAQIKEAEASRSMLPLFVTAQDAGMTDEEFKGYHALGIEATQDAMTDLEARGLRDLKWLSNAKGRAIRKLQKEAEVKRAAIRKEVTAEVLAEPVNQARQFLKRGTYNLPKNATKEQRRLATEAGLEGHKLSLPMLKEMYGEEANAIWRNLPTGQYGYVAAEGGLHPDAVADMFGYGSGDELVRDLLAAENPKDKIAGITDQRMLERYGDLSDQQAIERAAEAAIHNDARARFIATEMNALQKALGSKKILASAAKEYAATMVNRQKLRELSPARYTAAEARASKASAEAFKKGDTATAAAEKRAQLVQNYAAKAAIEAQERVEKGVTYFKKFERDSIRKTVDPEYVDQINALLERYDFKKRSLKEIDKRASLADWVKAQQEVGIEPNVPKEILEGIGAKNYRDMTVEEFDGLMDTIRQIEHLGRLKNKLLTAADNRTFDATVAAITQRISESAGNKPPVDNATPNNADRAGRAALKFKSFVAAHRKVANIVRELDGWTDGGPMWDAFVRSMNKAGDKEATMRAQATRQLAELVAPVLKQGKMGGKGTYFPTIGRSLNREARLAIALNMGNLGNAQRLLDGEGWTLAQLQPVLDTLSKEDWDFVQKVWDFFESFRPQIAAKERRVYGVEPEWVEPHPVTTPFGQYRGGYYPIKFDPARSAQAEQFSDAEAAKQMMQGAFTSATTRRSFTKSRADEVKGRPLMYSMDGIFQGVNEVIHDLSWHEWLIDANRILRSRRIDSAIRNRFGALYMRQLKTAMQDIAVGEIKAQNALDSVLQHVRTGASIAGLGLNLKNAIINLTGAMQSVVRIGPAWMAQGVGHFVANPKAAMAEMYEKSEMMRNRAQTFNREVNEIRNQIAGETDARRRLNMLMYLPMTTTQIAVDTPTWWGAYNKAISEGNIEDRAIALADQAVIDAQGGGQMKDLAAIQRGGEGIKLFTTFYGYFSTTYNLTVEATKKTNFKDPASVMQLAGNYVMLYTVPALLGTLIAQAMSAGGGGDDEERLLKNIAKDQIGYMMSTVVGARELTGMVQTVAGVNPYGGGYGGPAGLRFIDELYGLGQQIHQGKADMGLLKSVINVGGIALHLPGGQINRTIDGVVALSEGKTSNPLAVVAGPPPKK